MIRVVFKAVIIIHIGGDTFTFSHLADALVQSDLQSHIPNLVKMSPAIY